MSDSPIHPDEQMIHLYLDDELSREAHHQFETHLQKCPACQSKLAMVRQLFETIQTVPEIRLDKDLSRSVVAVLEQPLAMSSRMGWLLAGQLLVTLPALILIWVQNRSAITNSRLNQELLLQTITNYVSEFARSWQLWVENFTRFFIEMRALFDRPQLLTFSNAGIYLMVLGGVVLWLAGNRLLLPISLPNKSTKLAK